MSYPTYWQKLHFITNCLLGLWWEERRKGDVHQRKFERNMVKHLIKMRTEDGKKRLKVGKRRKLEGKG